MTRFPLLLLTLSVVLVSGCAAAPRRVAIMDFENASGQPQFDFLSTALPEYLTAHLANCEGILLLERQDIHRYLEEIDAERNDLLRASRWQKLGRRIDAKYLVTGSLSRLDQNFIITARLFSVGRGQIVPGTAVTQTCIYQSEIYDRARIIAGFLARQLRPRTGLMGLPWGTGGGAGLPVANE